MKFVAGPDDVVNHTVPGTHPVLLFDRSGSAGVATAGAALPPPFGGTNSHRPQ